MTYAAEEQTKNYSADRAGLQEAARDLVQREAEPEERETESAPVWAEAPETDTPPAEEKGPVSLNEWRKEHEAEREAFAKFRNEQGESADDPLAMLSEEPAEQPDPEELAIQRLIESGAATKEDIARGYELLSQREERKLQEKQTEFAQTYLDIQSRVQSAGSTFGLLQRQLQAEFKNRFGVDPANMSEADARALVENPNIRPVFDQFVQEANQILQPHAVALHQAQAQQAQAQEVFNHAQDQEFEQRLAKDLPHVKGEARQRVTNHIMESMRAEGLSDADIAALWQGSATVPFRHAAMQTMAMKAALYDLSRKKAFAAQRMPLPPVLRPGVAGPRRNPNSEEIAALKRKPSLSVREAARLSLLRQEARGE